MASKPSNEVLALLSAFDWDKKIPRLLTYADKKAQRLYWRGIRGGVMPEGMNASDVVSLAIEKLYSGERKWDPVKHPDLYFQIKDTIVRIMSNLCTLKENNLFVGDIEMGGNSEDEFQTSPIDNQPSRSLNIEEQLIKDDDMQDSDDYFWSFYEFLQDDPLLQSIIECIESDIAKPAEIATKLQLPVKEINNAKKRLQRKLTEFQSVWGNRKSI